MAQFSGKIKFFNTDSGYGFINSDQFDKEIFVHATGLQDEVKKDDTVIFETKEGKKGIVAVNVRLA